MLTGMDAALLPELLVKILWTVTCLSIAAVSKGIISCAKKGGGGPAKSAKSGKSKVGAAPDNNNNKSAVAPASPAPNISNGATPTPTTTPPTMPEGAKESGEKPPAGDKKDAKEKPKEKEEDSFEQHKPIVREAKRAEEIKKHGPVDNKRKDYKTIRLDQPSSDFDNSLGLPEKPDKADENKQDRDKKTPSNKSDKKE